MARRVFRSMEEAWRGFEKARESAMTYVYQRMQDHILDPMWRAAVDLSATETVTLSNLKKYRPYAKRMRRIPLQVDFNRISPRSGQWLDLLVERDAKRAYRVGKVEVVGQIVNPRAKGSHKFMGGFRTGTRYMVPRRLDIAAWTNRGQELVKRMLMTFRQGFRKG